MDAHGIDVLDGADDDGVVVLVADDLHLILLPSEYGFFDQHLVDRGGIEAAGDDLDELVLVVGDAAAGAAHGEGWADDGGQAHKVEAFQRLFHGVGDKRAGALEADLVHRLAEQEPVLGLFDGVLVGTDQLDAEFLQHALFSQRQGAVERRLAAHGGEHRVRLFSAQDLLHHVRRDRLDIGRVRQLRVGHDRRRVGVHQNDPVAVLLQRLAGLGARVIKLAGLPDDDRPGADDEDAVDVVTFGHGLLGALQSLSPCGRGRGPSPKAMGG